MPWLTKMYSVILDFIGIQCYCCTVLIEQLVMAFVDPIPAALGQKVLVVGIECRLIKIPVAVEDFCNLIGTVFVGHITAVFAVATPV